MLAGFRTRVARLRRGPGAPPRGDGPRVLVRHEGAGAGIPVTEPISPESVREELERILASNDFRYSGRLSRFLRFVVEQRLAGKADQLKESVLAVEIFDRETSYDPRDESVVRVQARRVREKLEHYYARDGAHDPVTIVLPKGTYAPVFAAAIHAAGTPPDSKEPASAPPESGRPPLPLRWVVLVAAVSVLATLAVSRIVESRRPQANSNVLRLTADTGLTFQPALSRDGKLLSYVSDRGGGGHLDIWVQQISGGAPVRLTNGPGDNLNPSFSPDGSLIAYEAEGDAGGVYLVPTLGGASTLLARDGSRPLFSPDGARIAYWTGARSFGAAGIFIVPVNGGVPSAFQQDFRYAAYPVWSADGSHLLFVGSKRAVDPNADEWGWWVAPADGGPAIETSARSIFARDRLLPPSTGWAHRRILPYGWDASGRVIFSARSGDATNIWRVTVSPRNWKAVNRAEQITFGIGRQDYPALGSDGSIAFSALTEKADLWSLAVRPDASGSAGPPERLTAGAGNAVRATVSFDGTRIAYLSNRNGNNDVWTRDLNTGSEVALTATRDEEYAAILSSDGSTVAFGYPGRGAIFLVPFSGGKHTQLCTNCGEPRAFLPAGDAVLYQRTVGPSEWLIGRVDLTGKTTTLVKSSEVGLFSPCPTHDGKWLVVIARKPPSDHRAVAIPIHQGSLAPGAEWVSLTDPGVWVDKPRWSAVGNAIYFYSDQDGFVCLWVRPVDPASKRPVGEARPLAHFHEGRNSIGSVDGVDLSAARDKLVFSVGQEFGNIWISTPGK